MRAVPKQMFASGRSDPRVACALVALGLAVLAVLMQLPFYARSAVPLDEGHLAAAASRLLDGELLYRDIHTGIFPGVYYFAALLFGIFGHDLVVARWAQLGINAAVVVLLWLLGSRVVRPGWTLLPPLLYLSIVAFSFPVLTLLNYSSLALCTGLATLFWMVKAFVTAEAQARR